MNGTLRAHDLIDTLPRREPLHRAVGRVGIALVEWSRHERRTPPPDRGEVIIRYEAIRRMEEEQRRTYRFLVG